MLETLGWQKEMADGNQTIIAHAAESNFLLSTPNWNFRMLKVVTSSKALLSSVANMPVNPRPCQSPRVLGQDKNKFHLFCFWKGQSDLFERGERLAMPQISAPSLMNIKA